MAAGTRSIDLPLPSRKRLAILGSGALYLLVTGAALELVAMILGNPMSAILVGAMAVAVIVARAGLTSESNSGPARRRALHAALASGGVIVAIVAMAVLFGAQLVAAKPTTTALFGAAEGFALAYVGELWLHGLPLWFARRAQIPMRYAYPYAVVAGLAPTLLDGGFSSTTLLLAAASGAFFTALWVRSGDAWAPVAAHFVFVWGVDSLLAGDVLHLGATAGRVMHGPGSHGPVAWAAAFVFSALTLLVLLNKLRFDPAADGEA